MTSKLSLKGVVPTQNSGSRFDQIAAEMFPDYSRACIQGWIKSGDLTVDGECAKPKTKLSGGEELILATEIQSEGDWEAQDIPLEIVYEDDSIIVLNKPSSLVVHPGAGNWDGTLLNGLIFRFPELRELPRAGIVHRLDKDTSGLMVVARTLPAQNSLVKQLQDRSVSRVYQALVVGECGKGRVDAPIGRHRIQRVKMAVVDGGKPAKTRYETLEVFDGYSFVQLALETGRTHQIRVHMAHIAHPLIGDPVYGRAISKSQLMRDERLQLLETFPRQALHAIKLGLIHPKTGKECAWECDLPKDFESILSHLRAVF